MPPGIFAPNEKHGPGVDTSRLVKLSGKKSMILPTEVAGQLHDYVLRKLTNWSTERGQDPKNPDTSAIMQPIAHSLTEPQIRAVAAYLNHLE